MKFQVFSFKFQALLCYLCFLLLNLSCFGQSTLTADGLAAIVPQTTSSGGGSGGTYTLMSYTNAVAGNNTALSVTVNITGAGLLVVSESFYQPASPGDAFCSDGVNTYVRLTPHGSSIDRVATNQLSYVINPSGGTITITCKHSYTVLIAAWFSYSASTPLFDNQSGAFVNSGSATTIQPGALAPTGTELFITGEAETKAFASTPIDSSFTVIYAIQEGSAGLWGGLAYKNSSTIENPTWSFSASSTDAGVTMGIWK